jgi:hypothetical protein
VKKEEKVMKNNVIRLITIIMLAVMIMSAFSGLLLASEGISYNQISPKKTTENAVDNTGTAQTVLEVIQAILTVAQVIGVGTAVIMLIVLAIKYISAAPNDKAEIKKHMVVYVVGAVVLFGASGILEVIKKFAQIFNKNTGAES